MADDTTPTPPAPVSQEALDDALRTANEATARAAEATKRANELAAQNKAREEAQMEKDKQFQELSTKRGEEVETLKREKAELQSSIERDMKKAAVRNAIGGVKKDEYLNFIDLNAIQIIDGRIDPTTVTAEAERFKTTYPDLLTGGPAVPQSGSAQPPPVQSGKLNLDGKTTDELTALLGQVLSQKS